MTVWMWDAPYTSIETPPTPFGGYDFTATSSNPAVVSIDSVWDYATVSSRCPVLAPRQLLATTTSRTRPGRHGSRPGASVTW